MPIERFHFFFILKIQDNDLKWINTFIYKSIIKGSFNGNNFPVTV